MNVIAAVIAAPEDTYQKRNQGPDIRGDLNERAQFQMSCFLLK